MCGIFFYKGILNNLPNILQASTTILNRGPENTTIHIKNNSIHCFHRLAINNTSDNCNQPYYYNEGKYTYTVMCNGEIYNWKELINKYTLIVNKNNDCGILFPLFKELNYNFSKLCSLLDGEFAMVITSHLTQSNEIDNIWFANDMCSVRPLFYTHDTINNTIVISSLLSGISEINNIKSTILRTNGSNVYHFVKNSDNINFNYLVYPYDDVFRNFNLDDDIKKLNETDKSYEYYMDNIYNLFTNAVHKRISDDNMSRPIGCLLSGGLDSSLVAAVASTYMKIRGKTLNTFSIGMKGATDLEYAKKVADHIGSNHTEIIFTEKEGLDAIKEVVKVTESYDITTIRASVGQYLLAKWISKNTDIKILLNGDGADECQMGYLYFYNAPNEVEAQKDSIRLVENIHYFDGLRVDRNISHHGLEARVPYLDKELVRYYLNEIPSKFKVPSFNNSEKFLIRKTFEKFNLLPTEVLWRRKEAFSDGISSLEKSWYQILTHYFDGMDIPDYLDREFNPPYTKESVFYRLLFEQYFKANSENVIPRFWLPSWSNETDPSARKLKVYS